MRFALLGDHPDGLDMARALTGSGRHQLVCYCGPAVGQEWLRRWDLAVPVVTDLEEVLADPSIEAIVVAGPPGDRLNQLRRALQSERHVLCVHPPAPSPDGAYEAAMLQGDSGKLLIPLLGDALHPAISRLRSLIDAAGGFRLLELERWSTESILLDADVAGHKPSLPGWDVLRALGGEVAEVSGYARGQELVAEEPFLIAGQFEKGGLFQMSLVPRQPESRWRLAALTTYDRIELTFPEGWPGPATLRFHDARGMQEEEMFDAWNPWPALVEGLENPSKARVSWHDAVRCLELDDALRRSVERRRTSILEYQEATEEAGFKGTMTLLGCGLLWTCVVLLVLSRWVPWMGYLIVPVIGFFLVMQLLRWAVPANPGAAPKSEDSPQPRP